MTHNLVFSQSRTPPALSARHKARQTPRPAPVCSASASAMAGEARRDASSGASAPSPPPGEAALPSQSFLRPHLLTLAAYTPIEPFEVLSERLGRSTDDIIKLDANENPYGPPPEVRKELNPSSHHPQTSYSPPTREDEQDSFTGAFRRSPQELRHSKMVHTWLRTRLLICKI